MSTHRDVGDRLSIASSDSSFVASFHSLGHRERSVLELIAQGYSSKQIAAELKISTGTVRTYRTRILAKFGRHETMSIIAEACARGLLRP